MAIQTETTVVAYLNVSAGVPVSCDFPVYAADEVKVFYGNAATMAVPNVDYTVHLNDEDDFNTFEITPLGPLIDKINALISSDETEINRIVVRRVIEFITSASPDLMRSTVFASRERDRVAMALIQLNETINRSLVLSPGFVGTGDPALQLDELIPGRVLTVSEAGTSIVAGPSVGEVENAAFWAGKSREWAVSPALIDDSVNVPNYSSRWWALYAETKVQEAQDVIDGGLAFLGRQSLVKYFAAGVASVALDIDPGSKNNVSVFIGGVGQSPATYDLQKISGVSTVVFSENTPEAGWLVYGNADTELVPADGSVTFAKMQNVNSARLLGRKSAGAGSVEELTASDLVAFLPNGCIVGGASALINDLSAVYNVANSAIPTDNTIPQNTEGKAVPGWSITITPKSATNKIRIKFACEVYADAGSTLPAGAAYAIFSSVSPNALRAGRFRMNSTGPTLLVAEHIFTPGSLDPVTISVRLGVVAGTPSNTIFRLGYDTTSSFGGVENGTLTIEEVKS